MYIAHGKVRAKENKDFLIIMQMLAILCSWASLKMYMELS